MKSESDIIHSLPQTSTTPTCTAKAGVVEL